MKNLNGISYLERKPLIDIKKPPLLLLIHGYGSNEEDLYGFAESLPPRFFVVSVRGRYSLAPNMYAWYEINFTDMKKFNNMEQGLESRDRLLEFIDAIVEKENLDSKDVWLLGFSQGAILSYSIALNHPDKIQHAAILSGYPDPGFIGAIDSNSDFSNLDFFISHGVQDPVIPVDWARNGKPLLDKIGIKNEYHEYPAGHGVVPQNFYDLVHWMEKQRSDF